MLMLVMSNRHSSRVPPKNRYLTKNPDIIEPSILILSLFEIKWPSHGHYFFLYTI